jgi:hypothetical protein
MDVKSDFMLFNNISDLQFKDKKINDMSYMYQMSRTTPRCLIDRGDELNFLKYKPICVDAINTRGGNYTKCEPERSCPHPEYTKYYLNEFLLTPCPKPTYKNYIVCGEDKCCSKRHQLFKNITKRKDISNKML